MAKAFSVASWNVEHFRNEGSRPDRVIQFIEEQEPDVFALYEVEGREVFPDLVARMPRYSFFITEGAQVQEILVGVCPHLTAFFTQRTEFKSGDTYLRPGSLLTITRDEVHYPLLFMHMRSGGDPKGLGLRDDMLARAFEFRNILDKAPGAEGAANYIFLGDLNTMGMSYRYVPQRAIKAEDEIKKVEETAKRYRMRLLSKDAPATWSNGSESSIPPSNLDHVIAADHLEFKSFGGAEVSVRGWPKLSTASQQDRWIEDYSDHGLLYFEVQKV